MPISIVITDVITTPAEAERRFNRQHVINCRCDAIVTPYKWIIGCMKDRDTIFESIQQSERTDIKSERYGEQRKDADLSFSKKILS